MVEEIKTNNKQLLISVLSYFIVGIIWFFLDEEIKRRNRIAKFHVKQAINFFLIAIFVSIVSELIMMIFSVLLVIPFLGEILRFLLYIFTTLIGIILLILWISGIYYAIIGKRKSIPFIGNLAEEYLTF